MKKYIILLFFLQCCLLFSQKYGEAWIVGYSNDSTFIPKYGKTELNFSTGNLNIKYSYGEQTPDLGFTNASIADKDGNLRYFTDGYRIYNGSQKIIPNGDSINFGRIWQDYDVGGYPTEYNHILLPMPGDEENETVLFHFSLEYHSQFWLRYVYVPAFKMTKIKWNANQKMDVVLFKDSIVLNGDFVQKHMTCTRHANGRDWWIIIEDYLSNNHRVFLFDTSGINLYHTQQIGLIADSIDWSGNSIFTPDGTKFIKYLSGYQIQIFDFNRCSGTLTNARIISNDFAASSDLCFLAISPNSRFLYLNSDSLIWQYDLYANNIKGSETIIGIWDGFIFQGFLNTAFNQMSLAEDGKIYISCRASTNLIHVINNPNEKGVDCKFELRGVEIPAYMFGNFPQSPNYKLGPLFGSLCDSLRTAVKNVIKFDQEDLMIYPNPTSSFLYIHDVKGQLTSKVFLKLMDLKGEILFSMEYEDLQQEIKIPISKFPEGLYFVYLIDSNGNYWTEKFTKF